MIELLMQRLERGLQVGEVEKPAALRINISFANELDFKAVAVEAGALVSFGDIREAVGRFE